MSCSACRIFSTASTHLAAGSASMMSEAILRASKLLISSHSKIYIQLATIQIKGTSMAAGDVNGRYFGFIRPGRTATVPAVSSP